MSSMISKLILGTAGLGGLPYGRQGKIVEEKEARAIIGQAVDAGIRTFDVAPVYGQAERICGEALSGISGVTIYTKTTGSWEEAVESTRRLRPHRPCFLWHNFTAKCRVPEWVDGGTIYSSEDIIVRDKKYLFDIFYDEYHTPSIVQWPWNLLCQWIPPNRKIGFMWPSSTKIKYLARSVLLQGLLKDPFPKGIYSSPEIEVAILKADRLAHALGVNIQTLALRSALEMNFDGVVIGPQSIEELEECIAIAEMKPLNALPFIKELDLGDNPITDPRTWAA